MSAKRTDLVLMALAEAGYPDAEVKRTMLRGEPAIVIVGAPPTARYRAVRLAYESFLPGERYPLCEACATEKQPCEEDDHAPGCDGYGWGVRLTHGDAS